ncbi:MAG: 5-formyltetrahydrofolate cyclo-ligase [Clostridia bacterium]|nr:5-formyltetrahydrofolate cyclo-ligase [Clostridia bacterium]
MPCLPTEAKKELRRALRAKRRSIDLQQKAELDQALVAHTLTTKEFERAHTIFLYAPLSDEPNLLPLAEEAWKLGKQVAFPISHTDTHTLSFHTVKSFTELCEGAYGISEPPPSAQTVIATKDTLCIVPALAFDRHGFRLGYGGGYYDRLLVGFQGITLGLFYHEFLQNELPRGIYDRAVDLLITEKGVCLPDEIQTTK